jgi:IS605 OrfB family transposase
MYSVFEKKQSEGNKVQFIKVMSTIPRKMVIIPLTGYSRFSGTIRIILDFHKQQIELHTTNELRPIENQVNTVIPLDAGISEVFMDELGNAYEPTFGKTLGKVSKQLNKTMKARNKSYALKKTSSKHKAHRIAKFNLGKNKLRDRKRKAQVRIKQQISHSIHQVVRERKPATIVTERLDIRGKAKSKGMSRLVSYWMRGSLKERLSFLALAEGFCHKQVNPAYTSQMCPTCLFVHKGNRAGDIFHCLNCGHTDHADRIAAINLFARYYDPEITVYTPKSAVFSILQRRFAAPLERIAASASEALGETTVSGRTDTDRLLCQSETPLSKLNNGHGTEMSCLMTF